MRYLLATLALSCGLATAGQKSSPAAFTIVMIGDVPPPMVLHVMERETESALTPTAGSLDWKLGTRVAPIVAGPMAVIHMRGNCGLQGSAIKESAPVGSGIQLGVTHIANGRILPIADVFCDSVRASVARDLSAARAEFREQLWGRALGRVLAHELYHVLLQTTDHGDTGISRAAQTGADLLGPRNSFAASEVQRFAHAFDVPAE